MSNKELEVDRGLTVKESWWAGYRVGKGLPPDTPRQEALAAPSSQPATGLPRRLLLDRIYCALQGIVSGTYTSDKGKLWSHSVEHITRLRDELFDALESQPTEPLPCMDCGSKTPDAHKQTCPEAAAQPADPVAQAIDRKLEEVAASLINSFDQNDRLTPAYVSDCILTHRTLGAEPVAQTEQRPCKHCGGEGAIHTGIDEAPTTQCRKCDGTGIAPSQPAAAAAASRHPERELTDAEILLLICDHTGKRINLCNFTLDELKVFARALLAKANNKESK